MIHGDIDGAAAFTRRLEHVIPAIGATEGKGLVRLRHDAYAVIRIHDPVIHAVHDIAPENVDF